MSFTPTSLQSILTQTRFISHIPQPIRKTQDSRLLEFSSIMPVEKSRILEIMIDTKEASRPIGCLVGMAIGESSAVQWQFTPVVESSFTDLSFDRLPGNYLKLQKGQFTDITSMALCMSESLLIKQQLDPIDVRKRWFHWWFSGYCSGLADGNVSVGAQITTQQNLKDFINNPKKPFALPGNEAASCCYNGVYPLVVYLREKPEQAIQMCQYQSYITQGSESAAVCSATLAFILVRLMHHSQSPEETTFKNLKKILVDLLEEWASICHLQLVLHPDTQRMEGLLQPIEEIQQIVLSKPKDSVLNAHWNWKANTLPLRECSKKSPHFRSRLDFLDMFGCQATDTLALALHMLYHSETPESALACARNTGGNATGVSAMVGAIIGSFFGYGKLLESPVFLADYQKLMEKEKERVAYTASLIYLTTIANLPVDETDSESGK
jgi:ADP-ribosylglycohydrolase